MAKNNPCQGEHREFGKFAKTHENSGNFVCSSCKFPDSKCKTDISLFTAKIFNFFLSWMCLPSQVCVCDSHKSSKLAQGKFAVGQG